MRILVVTRAADRYSVEGVARELRERGHELVRLDTDRYPHEERVSVTLERGSESTELVTSGGSVRLEDVDALWVRQFDPGGALPRDMDPHLRHASILESRAVILGLIESAPGFCLDRPSAVRRAESKELQLRLARGLGLDTPRTCITNDPARARAFLASCPEGAVAKMMEPPRLPVGDGTDAAVAGRVMHTAVVDESALARLDDLTLCPIVFQERLHKARELRITIVGQAAFAAELDSASIPGAEVDWRRVPQRVMSAWRATGLEDGLRRSLCALLDAVGLQYGAFDLIETHDGRLVFLEVNPGGQYHWLELHAGLPISAAIADTLAEPGLRRPLQPAARVPGSSIPVRG